MKRTLVALALCSLALTACGGEEAVERPTTPSTSTPSDSPDVGTEEPTDPATPDPGTEPTEPTEPPTEPVEPEVPTEPTDPVTPPSGDDARFQAMSNELTGLFKKISELDDEGKEPKDAAEANRLAGLNEGSSLRFIDYYSNNADQTGGFCIASEADTYFTFSYDGERFLLTFGDGEDCSYDGKGAVVVGDLITDKWSKGGELMGTLTPAKVLAEA